MSKARDIADGKTSGGGGFKNLIINGAMNVWQRGTTIDSITTANYLCDHWRIAHYGTDGNVDVDRSTDVPSGEGFGSVFWKLSCMMIERTLLYPIRTIARPTEVTLS